MSLVSRNNVDIYECTFSSVDFHYELLSLSSSQWSEIDLLHGRMIRELLGFDNMEAEFLTREERMYMIED